MYFPQFLKIAILLGIIGCFTSCAKQVAVQQGSNEFGAALLKAKNDFRENPDRFESVRELGILYHKTRQFKKAIVVLENARKLNPRDARTACYLGLSYEFINDFLLATGVYSDFDKDTSAAEYVKWLKGRQGLVKRKQIRSTMTLALKESGIDEKAETENRKRVLILPVNYHGDETRYGVLRKGLTAQLTTDISRIDDVKTIPREEIEILLQEIEKRESLRSLAHNTAKIGKLLNADIVLKGDFNVVDDLLFVWEIAYLDPQKDAFPNGTTIADTLKNALRMQKKIVSDFAEKFDIEIRPAARKLIDVVPTKNDQAFLAYCAGLAKTDEGEYEEAQIYYQKALELDPGFRICADKLLENAAFALALKDPDKACRTERIVGRVNAF